MAERPAPTDDPQAYLGETEFLDIEHPALRSYAERVAGDSSAPVDQASSLFLAVRDGLRYDPYSSSRERADYRASAITEMSRAWCVPKAVLLTACARAVGIPARLGFADVRNHLQSEQLHERMGTDLFMWHGYTELWLQGRWLKATPAFNIEMCERFGVLPLTFDGTADALLHPYDSAGQRHMEYVNERGVFADLPFEDIMASFDEFYDAAVTSEPVHDEMFHGPA